MFIVALSPAFLCDSLQKTQFRYHCFCLLLCTGDSSFFFLFQKRESNLFFKWSINLFLSLLLFSFCIVLFSVEYVAEVWNLFFSEFKRFFFPLSWQEAAGAYPQLHRMTGRAWKANEQADSQIFKSYIYIMIKSQQAVRLEGS